MPATRLLLCICLCVTGAAALVARPPVVTRLPAAAAAVRSARVGMQVAEPPVKIPDFAPATPDSAKQTNPKGGKKYKLLLFNDNVNRREYVAKILVQSVPDVTSADAYQIMQQAHKSGLAVVGTWVLELCEVGRYPCPNPDPTQPWVSSSGNFAYHAYCRAPPPPLPLPVQEAAKQVAAITVESSAPFGSVAGLEEGVLLAACGETDNEAQAARLSHMSELFSLRAAGSSHSASPGGRLTPSVSVSLHKRRLSEGSYQAMLARTIRELDEHSHTAS